MCLADFVSCYDVLYGMKKMDEREDFRIRSLSNKCGKVRIRNKRAILRYYLRFENEEEEMRGILILFLPFRDEIKDIHNKDIHDLYRDNISVIDKNERKFAKNIEMSNLINDIQKQREEKVIHDFTPEVDEYEETTSAEEINEFEAEFEKWAKQQGEKSLRHLQQFTDVIEPEQLRKLINTLNSQQRKIFDDLIEREISRDIEKDPYYVFIAGDAGTGKSYLTTVVMEAFKSVNIKSGKELGKPSILAMAPTANAAYIISGQTIEAALGLSVTN